ncbi:MAG: glycosyltransferase family 39 protein, partial [Chitinophagaceae bacterium]
MQTETGQQSLHRTLFWLIGFAIFINFSGLFVPLMDPDAGVYASISKSIAQRHDYVNLYFQEADWLDKPHFPFWVTAVFFKVFGYHEWSYKLPGILFTLMGAYYTFLFARKFYNTTIALWSSLILLTAMHIIISNNDVRAEPFLTGLIIAAVYHFSNALDKKPGWQLVAACFYTGCAVMTKGIFTLIPVGGAVAGELILQKKWRQLFHWKWILAAVLTGIFIIPELYCLWKQFDTHPEKTVLGSDHVSGIKFFLWDSQFGRFFNTGPIKGKGDKLFFLHTLLWAFLPWALLMYAALFTRIRNRVKKVTENFNEWFTLSGSLLTLLLFSFSGFQLPHYTNIIFPFLAILTAAFVVKLATENRNVFGKVQSVLNILLLVLVAGLLFFYKPAIPLVFLIVAAALLTVFLFP